MDRRPVIYWFRQDLRLADLPGLAAAAAEGRPVVPCYILDDEAAGRWAMGAASRWWLHHSLESLRESIAARGGALVLRRGPTREVLEALANEFSAEAVHCSRCIEPAAAALEKALHSEFSARGTAFRRFPGSLLFEPEQVANRGGRAFRVFTPFWKHCLGLPAPAAPLPIPPKLKFPPIERDFAACADSLELQPRNPDRAAGWRDHWQPGEAGAAARLADFLARGIDDYEEGRDYPARRNTSRLSAHLHFGEISPRQLWHAARSRRSVDPESGRQIDKFLSELGWREFSHHLLHHFPHLPERAFRENFSDFPWLGDAAKLEVWQRGRTGYPIVDAGMRELRHTGYMHNRVRMIAASFLTKHLLLPWQAGESWFWDTLVDADLANNACGWQWVAGSGADAAPYFRIFNPAVQGRKFDAGGDYVRRWVPELAGLPDRHLHDPSSAPRQVLADAGVKPGSTYPQPVVDHREAREAAMAAYGAIRLRS